MLTYEKCLCANTVHISMSYKHTARICLDFIFVLSLLAVVSALYSLRIVSEWNKLPQDIVEAPSINTFKNRLDRHWHDMGILS